MKAVLIERPSEDLSGLGTGMVAEPVAAPGEVVVAMEAACLNPVDWKLATTGIPAWTYPHVPGLDGAGTILAVGEGVGNFAIGDRVVWHGDLSRAGVFAEQAAVPAHVLSHMPSGVGFLAAAAVPCAGYTAYQALIRKARIGPGDTVVIQGAAGAVGGFGVQIAAQAGARVIALARADAAQRVRALGAHEVLEARDADLAAKVRALTDGYGADTYLEIANPGDARRSLALLRFNGQLLVVDPPAVMDEVPVFSTGAGIHEVALGAAYLAGHLPTQRDFALIGDAMMEKLARGRLDPLIAAAIDLDAVPGELKRLRGGGIGGKIVVAIGARAAAERAARGA
ncbi:MAG: zinc-binding dehydrogenase [Acuticoccus sp.]